MATATDTKQNIPVVACKVGIATKITSSTTNGVYFPDRLGCKHAKHLLKQFQTVT